MKTRLILETLKGAGKTTEFLLNVFLGGFDYKKLKEKALYPTLPDFSRKDKIKIDSQLLQKEKHKLYSLLSKLKKQGFVKKEQGGKNAFWKITLSGEKKYERLKSFLNFPKFNYKKEKANGINIVVFDIPEKDKAKRNWLRYTLVALGFTMLQKSVWAGKNKLPEEFLRALAELGLIDFIHIFKISKTGTISIRQGQ